MLEKGYYDKADAIIKSHGAVEASLIPIIQDIQSEYRYLPPEFYLMLQIRLGLQRRRRLVLLHFMRIFLLNQRENM